MSSGLFSDAWTIRAFPATLGPGFGSHAPVGLYCLPACIGRHIQDFEISMGQLSVGVAMNMKDIPNEMRKGFWSKRKYDSKGQCRESEWSIPESALLVIVLIPIALFAGKLAAVPAALWGLLWTLFKQR
jgi:hypothetical protein